MSDILKLGKKLAPLNKGIIPLKSQKELSIIKKPSLVTKTSKIDVKNDTTFSKPLIFTKNDSAKLEPVSETSSQNPAKILPINKNILSKKPIPNDNKSSLNIKDPGSLKAGTTKFIVKNEQEVSNNLNAKIISQEIGINNKVINNPKVLTKIIENKTSFINKVQPNNFDPTGIGENISKIDFHSQLTGKNSSLNLSSNLSDATILGKDTIPETNVFISKNKALNLNSDSIRSTEEIKLTNKDETKFVSQNRISKINNEVKNMSDIKRNELIQKEIPSNILSNNTFPTNLVENKGNINNQKNIDPANFQFLDPAFWQMITTIATICSTACQNNRVKRSKHCCRRHHLRKHKKESDQKETVVKTNTQEVDESKSEDIEIEDKLKERNEKKNEKPISQNENVVSGTKWYGIEKKLANIRGMRDLEDIDSNIDDEELIDSNSSPPVNPPKYIEEDDFPGEIPARNVYEKRRKYLAKQGICTGPKFSKNPFVGGLSATRRRPYSSLTEMAAYFSNIEPQDQNDVILMLLACRKLEKQIEEQQVVMQLLEHDLKEAQSLLRFPPEWRSLNSTEIIGHPPLPAGQIPSTNDPPYISNHPGIEPPWMNKRPKDSLPSRAPTKL